MTALGAALIAARRSEVCPECGQDNSGLGAHPDWCSRPRPSNEWDEIQERYREDADATEIDGAIERIRELIDDGESDPPKVDHGPPIRAALRGLDTGTFARRGDSRRPALYQERDDREAKRRAKLVELAVWTLHSDEGCTVRTEAGTLLPTHDPYVRHQAMAVRIVDALHPKGAL